MHFYLENDIKPLKNVNFNSSLNYYSTLVSGKLDYYAYGSPMPMRRNLVQCSVVYDTTISNIYALNDTFNGAGNTGSFVGAIGTTVSNPSGNELEVSSTTVYPVISSTISTTTGKEYIVSADLNGMSFSPGYIASVLCEVIEGGVTVASQSSTAPGNFNFTYTAGAGSASVRYTFVLTPNPGPPPPPPMAPFSFTLDNAMVYFIDTSISSETVCVSKNGYRYGFNGMEKVDEIVGEGNGYDFGARMYDGRLGRWFSVDPFSMEYNSVSAYSFGLNSSISYGDYFGFWIIGSDGKPISYKRNNDGTITWSENTTMDVIIIATIMFTTEIGEEAFNKWMNSSTKVKLIFNTTKFRKDERSGETIRSFPDLIFGPKKNGEWRSVTVNILLLNIIYNINQGPENDRWGSVIDIFEAIGGVATHEVGHIDPKQIKLDRYIPNEMLQDPNENIPINMEIQFRKEYRFKRGVYDTNWLERYKKLGYEKDDVILIDPIDRSKIEKKLNPDYIETKVA